MFSISQPMTAQLPGLALAELSLRLFKQGHTPDNCDIAPTHTVKF